MGDFLYFVLQSSLLIVLVLLIGKVGKNSLSARARYALWLIPMVRLLFFVSPIALTLPEEIAALHPYALVREMESAPAGKTVQGNKAEKEEMSGTGAAGPETDRPESILGGADDPAVNSPKKGEKPVGSQRTKGTFSAGKSAVSAADSNRSAKTAFLILWAAGSLAAAGAVIFQNAVFFKRIKKEGVLIEREALANVWPENAGMRLKVCYVKDLPSPCLAGLVHPMILLNDRAMEDEGVLKMVLAHEMAHYRQKDHIWNFFRNFFCIVYWFRPIVWIGAAASKRAAELSCDERVTLHMEKQERKEYGLALIRLLEKSTKEGKMPGTTTAMTGEKEEMRERIRFISKRKSTKKWVLAIVLVSVLLAAVVGCTQVKAPDSETAGNSGDKGAARQSETQERQQEETGGRESAAQEQKEVLLEKKYALFSARTIVGPDGGSLDYVGERILIFHDYYGLAVFEYAPEDENELPGIIDTLDLRSIGCTATQGDSYAEVYVSTDGNDVYLHAFDSTDWYHYDVARGELYHCPISFERPAKEELFQRPVEGDGVSFNLTWGGSVGELSVSKSLLGTQEDIPLWTPRSSEYMKKLKAHYDIGAKGKIVDEGWENLYPQQVRRVPDIASEGEYWRWWLETVDEGGNCLEDPADWKMGFEKTDQDTVVARIGVEGISGQIEGISERKCRNLFYSWEDRYLLFYRTEDALHVIDNVKGEAVFDFPPGTGDADIYLYPSEEMSAYPRRDRIALYTLAGYEIGKMEEGTLSVYEVEGNGFKRLPDQDCRITGQVNEDGVLTVWKEDGTKLFTVN